MRHSMRLASLVMFAPLFVTQAFGAGAPPAVAQPAPVVMYQVRGLKWNGWQYVAQPGYVLTTPNFKQAQDYAAQFACFPGWSVATNLPTNFQTQSIPAAPAPANNPALANVPPYILNWLYSMGIQPSQLRPAGPDDDADAAVSSAVANTSSDTSDIQNMLATQDMINRQQDFNNIQDMINTQNFINTENMINNMQNDVNTQNMVNEQNMINAMNN